MPIEAKNDKSTFDVVAALRQAAAKHALDSHQPLRLPKKAGGRKLAKTELKKPKRKLNLDIFEAHELGGGVRVEFSDKFCTLLGADLEPFGQLHNTISHLRSNSPEEITPQMMTRTDRICQKHLGIDYNDLSLLSGTIRSCLMDAKQRSDDHLQEAVAQLNVHFLPRKTPNYPKDSRTRHQKLQRLLEIVNS